jgi:universal stress protein E
MVRRESILAVVDPVSDTQPALDRAIYLARNLGMHLDLFICDYNANLVAEKFFDKKALKRAKEETVKAHLSMLDELAGKVEDAGIPHTVQAAWDRPLHEGVIRQALHADARYVLKDTHFHSAISRAVFTNTDWHLIRTCPAPLWLVKPETDFDHPSIMAAVDPLHEKDQPAEFDARILSEACALADALEGITLAVHVFNPYLEPDDPQLMETRHAEALQASTRPFQVSDDRIHLVAGVASDVLPHLAREHDASLVVMGSLARSRLENAMVGSTAEKVLDQLSCDVLVIKPKGYLSPVNLKQRPRGYHYQER